MIILNINKNNQNNNIINTRNLKINKNLRGSMIKPSLALMLNMILLTMLSRCHYIPKIKGEKVYIQSYVNQAKQIQIPFQKCFQVEPQLPANSKYIDFVPSSLKLTQISELQISENYTISVLEDLRSPQSYNHQHLIVFNNYAITFMPLNTFIIIKQKQNKHYSLYKKIIVKQVDIYSQFKLYKFNQQAIMFLFGQSVNTRKNQNQGLRAFIINSQQYFQISIPHINSIAFFQSRFNQFFTAEYTSGIQCYSYYQTTKKVELVASYSKQQFKNLTQTLYIVDIDIEHLYTDKIIYVLDGISGVYKINVTQSNTHPKIELIVNQPNCNAMDSTTIDHIVLVCQLGSASYIVQVYGTLTQSGQMVFNKLQPEYHINYFNDLQINKNYFLVFSHRTLNVYWSSRENNIPQTVNTRSQLDLPGLETFYFKMGKNPTEESYLYLIQSGKFKQMVMTESNARLSIKSSVPIEKTFALSIFGNCRDLGKQQLEKVIDSKQNIFNISTNERYNNLTCQYEKFVIMEIYQQNLPRKQDFSVSASIIVILIVIFLLIIWICLKKYKGLQRQARKVLEAYKKKRSRI